MPWAPPVTIAMRPCRSIWFIAAFPSASERHSVRAVQSSMYWRTISAKFAGAFSPSRAARTALAPVGQFATMPAMRSSRT